MAEWKLTNKSVEIESQWKPTGKTVVELPNKPVSESKMV